ncbi:hypothetical protein CEUSTIGMA_g9515.t1 [Chlamydomonas eustigma]|uniref:RanBP2-type domain-containing protein n=1 Tax=Chlamydomonas eustigma TaxID=1157962 RepID=A0A250XG87_9CHLO|nr:hypothetical protein CEUSTIGMA_g9515.t1 [Chlamydomonas eustigma]|eukprot:GAX82087.1 hypothetical protein CEUSTIGMA_g9515.t1 [Chlamydomonas eustigma]
MAKDKKGSGKGTPAENATSSGQVTWECIACGQENEAADDLCCACEEPRPAASTLPGESSALAGYVVGLVTSSEPVPKKDRLTVLKVDIGAEEEIQVVTNASNVVVGSRVVLATVGALFREHSSKSTTSGSLGFMGQNLRITRAFSKRKLRSLSILVLTELNVFKLIIFVIQSRNWRVPQRHEQGDRCECNS